MNYRPCFILPQRGYKINIGLIIWAASRQNQQNDSAPSWRLRSAWASAQSDQSLHCVLNGYLRTQAFFMLTAKTLIRLGGYPGWSESSLGAHVIMLVLSWGSSYYMSETEESSIFLPLLMGHSKHSISFPCWKRKWSKEVKKLVGSKMRRDEKYMDCVKRIWYLSPMRAAKV